MPPLQKIVFLGSSEFAVPSLQVLSDSVDFRPLAVITQPDRPSGRNLKMTFTPVKKAALQLNLPVVQPEDINSAEAREYLENLHPDLLIVIAYGQKLKSRVRNISKNGAINLHPSLLPALRGAAPIPFALWQGLKQTGLTIFQLTDKMDAGPILAQMPLFIFPDENATDMTERFAYIGAQFLLEFLQKWHEHDIEPILQDESKATYCRKLEKEDFLLKWNKPAIELQNHIRALSLTPGAYTIFRGRQLKILQAEVKPEQSSYPAGSIVSIPKNEGFCVQTKEGQLLLKKVQPAGKKVMSAWDYHLGAGLEIGERMGSDA